MLRDIAYHSMDPGPARAWVAAGFWNDDTFGSILDRGLRAHPKLPVVIHSATHPYRETFA